MADLTRPHPTRNDRLQNQDIDRLLRQRQQSDSANRGLLEAPRNHFEMDDVHQGFQADEGGHLAYGYRTGKYQLQRRQMDFSQNAVLVAPSQTPPKEAEYSGIMTKLRVRVGVAPSTASGIFKFNLNGTDILTVTIPTGQFVAEATLTTRTRILCLADATALGVAVDVFYVKITQADGVMATLTGWVVI